MKSFTREVEERLKKVSLDAEEKLSPYACRNEHAFREFKSRNNSELIRSDYSIDVDKIIHCLFYNRGNDKTQVFSFYHNDDITRRASHVQLVSRIARSIGKALSLNLDLIEAIAIGHDIGHTPFGHKGEEFLNELYLSGCGKHFKHNVHSVRVLQRLSKCNLTLQTLDGILCHCGEKAFEQYGPSNSAPSFKEFNAILDECYSVDGRIEQLRPSTLEGCVVRISDMIAYVGKDRQDAAKLKLYRMTDYPKNILGVSNPDIISAATIDIISNSLGQPYISMSSDVHAALTECVKINNELIYQCDEVVEPYYAVVRPMMQILYKRFLDDFITRERGSVIFKHHYNNKLINYEPRQVDGKIEEITPHDIVTDFIASMTDDYFIKVFQHLYPESELNSKVKYVEYFNERYM